MMSTISVKLGVAEDEQLISVGGHDLTKVLADIAYSISLELTDAEESGIELTELDVENLLMVLIGRVKQEGNLELQWGSGGTA